MKFFRKKRTPEQEQARQHIDMLLETVGILNSALEKGHDDKAHEAVSVLLMQCLTIYGQNQPVMQQMFSVMDSIKRRIDSMDLDSALYQSKLFEGQLHEVKEITLGSK